MNDVCVDCVLYSDCEHIYCVSESYEKGRADERKKTIDEFAEKIREYSGKHYIDCDGYGCEKDLVFLTDEFLDDIIEKLKEQK